MPKLSTAEAPEKLRPYLFHGLQLKWEGKEDARGDCPFCHKERHFFVAQETGMWQCKLCGGPSKKGGGNVYSFLRELHTISVSSTPDSVLEEIAEERRLPVDSLQRAGLVQSAIDKELLLPGYGMTLDKDGKRNITNLYRWSKLKDKRRLVSTATMDHCLFGLQFWDDKKPNIYVCEGPWDWMALDLALRRYGLNDGKIFRTGNPTLTLFSKTNVVGSPGCETFRDEWVSLFKNKTVFLSYDSDYPKRFPEGHKQAGEIKMVRGKPMVPGFLGMESAAQKLKPVTNRISIIDWGGEGYDTSLPDGFDVRDYLTTTLVLDHAAPASALPQ